MKHYVVTGGCGFIGSHLVDELISYGHKVTVVDNLSSGKLDNLSSKAHFIEGCITNFELIKKITQHTDGIFHLAAIASVQECQNNWAFSTKINLAASINILQIARDYTIPIVFASSAAVYGNPEILPLTEKSSINPISAYGLDKYMVEYHAKLSSQNTPLRFIGNRFFNVYGPRQNPQSPYSGVIAIFLEKFQKKEAITIYGDGTQIRDFIHVSDVKKALIKSMLYLEKLPENLGFFDTFNICCGKSNSLNDLIDFISKIHNYHPKIFYQEKREGDIESSIGNSDKAKKTLGFKALNNLYEGIKSLQTGCGGRI